MANLAFAMRALRSRNYRLFFAGQSVSLIGTWMTRIATSWLVYRLTGSAVLLGVVGLRGPDSVIPSGTDRGRLGGPLGPPPHARRHADPLDDAIVRAGRAGAGAHHQGWEIIGLALFQGLINAFDMPARQAFVIQMVEQREDLGNAIALNSSMVNAARLMGPAIAGW